MKEFASFLLSALLVLSLAACGSNGDARSNASESSAGSTASSEAESSAAAAEEATATPKPTEEPSAQPTLEETVLLDEGGIKVTATDLTDYGLGGAPDLELHVENNTDGDIMVQTSEYAAVNGCMVRGIASIQASAGDSADDTVMFLDDEFEAAGIETVSDIKLAVRAIDADWNEICSSDYVTIKTSAYGTVETPAVNGDVLYDKDGVKVILLGTEEEEDFDFYFPTYVKLYIENNSEQDITVKTLDFKANGEVTQCSLNAELLAGTRQFTELRLDADSCTQNGITELKDLSFYFSICDLMTYNEITKSDTVTLEF